MKEKLTTWVISDLNKKGLSVKTKNTIIQIVKSVCRFSTNLYGIKNAAILLRKFKTPLSEIKEMETWVPEEFFKFINSIDNELYKIFFEMLYWTGARRGEILALTKDCVTDTGIIKIKKSEFMISDIATLLC